MCVCMCVCVCVCVCWYTRDPDHVLVLLDGRWCMPLAENVHDMCMCPHANAVVNCGFVRPGVELRDLETGDVIRVL